MLTSYAYASLSRMPFSETAMKDLLRSSAEKNARLGITGVLYSDQNVFFHVIEGEEATLAKLMSSILRDPRHESVIILDQMDLMQRAFDGLPIRHVNGDAASAGMRERFAHGNLMELGLGYVAERIRELQAICLSSDAQRLAVAH